MMQNTNIDFESANRRGRPSKCNNLSFGFSSSDLGWKPKELSFENSLKKMSINTEKAFFEAINRDTIANAKCYSNNNIKIFENLNNLFPDGFFTFLDIENQECVYSDEQIEKLTEEYKQNIIKKIRTMPELWNDQIEEIQLSFSGSQRRAPLAYSAQSFIDEVKKRFHKYRIEVERVLQAHQNKLRKEELQAIAQSYESAAGPIKRLVEEKMSLLTVSHAVEYKTVKKKDKEKREDVHFFLEVGEKVLGAVFDGHGGNEVAEYAKDQFEKKFFSFLKEKENNVYQTFENLIYEIQQELTNPTVDLIATIYGKKKEELTPERFEDRRKKLFSTGSAAAVFFLNKKTHAIFVGTIGDCEVKVYRKIQETIKEIPLSPIRNWGCAREAKRASRAFLQYGEGIPLDKVEVKRRNKETAEAIPKAWSICKDPKKIRFPLPVYGINVSRSLGDHQYTEDLFQGVRKKDPQATACPGIIAKPKLSAALVKPGDRIAVLSDGVLDFVSVTERVFTMEKAASLEESAWFFTEQAIENSSNDDATALVVDVQ